MAFPISGLEHLNDEIEKESCSGRNKKSVAHKLVFLGAVFESSDASSLLAV